MRSIQEITDFCKSIKVNPKKIFIDSKGSVVVGFHSKKHSERYEKALNKYYDELGYTATQGPEGWDDNAINEMEMLSSFSCKNTTMN